MTRFFEKSTRRRGQGARSLVAGVVVLLALTAPTLAAADDTTADPELRTMKTYWQNRYRTLLRDAERLREAVERETELYADANRRNYRRGNKRHVHREAALEAEQELAKVEAALATIEDDARRAGALPGWLYEVEFEMEEAESRPGIAAGPEQERDEEADAGRNPLYLDDEDL